MWTTFGISVWKRQSGTCQLVYKVFPAIGNRGAVVRWVPLSGDLSSSMRPKCISRIELGEVGRVSHSVVVTLAGYVGSRTKQPTLSPVPPYQLLERVYTDIVGVHGLDRDIALLQIALVDLVGMPCARGKQQHDNQSGPVCVVWVQCGRVCRGSYGFSVCARERSGRGRLRGLRDSCVWIWGRSESGHFHGAGWQGVLTALWSRNSACVLWRALGGC